MRKRRQNKMMLCKVRAGLGNVPGDADGAATAEGHIFRRERLKESRRYRQSCVHCRSGARTGSERSRNRDLHAVGGEIGGRGVLAAGGNGSGAGTRIAA